mmetsp:Transcript_70558/g.202142  ORF Transcript_70558/g.202142 Transcript_70558/m.202142 type:complete len:353 (+) Transcript_70558:814-1872(+)
MRASWVRRQASLQTMQMENVRTRQDRQGAQGAILFQANDARPVCRPAGTDVDAPELLLPEAEARVGFVQQSHELRQACGHHIFQSSLACLAADGGAAQDVVGCAKVGLLPSDRVLEPMPHLEVGAILRRPQRLAKFNFRLLQRLTLFVHMRDPEPEGLGTLHSSGRLPCNGGQLLREGFGLRVLQARRKFGKTFGTLPGGTEMAASRELQRQLPLHIADALLLALADALDGIARGLVAAAVLAEVGAEPEEPGTGLEAGLLVASLQVEDAEIPACLPVQQPLGRSEPHHFPVFDHANGLHEIGGVLSHVLIQKLLCVLPLASLGHVVPEDFCDLLDAVEAADRRRARESPSA